MDDSNLSVLVAAGFEELALVDQLPVVRWVGATGVQVWLNYAAPPEPAEVRRQVEEADLALRSIHGPFGPSCDPSSLEAEIREAALATLLDAVDLAAEAGAGYLVIHPGAEPIGDRPNERARRARLAAESIARLVPRAEARGVKLAVENMPPGHVGSRIDDLLEILRAVDSPRVGLCFDTGHANLVGRTVSMWRKAAPHVLAMHVHDNDGTADQHREPFSGSVKWGRLRNALVEVPYRGDFVLECLEALVALHRRGGNDWRDRFRRWWLDRDD